jgi:hypothetical protein
MRSRATSTYGRKLDDSKILAEAIVQHLELCGVEFGRKPPPALHATDGN